MKYEFARFGVYTRANDSKGFKIRGMLDYSVLIICFGA